MKKESQLNKGSGVSNQQTSSAEQGVRGPIEQGVSDEQGASAERLELTTTLLHGNG